MAFTSKWRFVVVLLFFCFSAAFWRLLEGFALRWQFTLIPLFFGVQILLADFVEHYLLRYMGLRGRWFSLVMAPGTILHEVSHLFAALFTGSTITDVSFFKINPDSNVLGFVEYLQPDDSWTVLRSFIVGFAPFFGCGLVLVGLNYIVVGEVFFPDQLAGVESVLGAVSSAVLSYYNAGVNPVFLAVVAYLSVCFALGSAPSTQDIKGFFFSMPKHIVSAIFFIGLIFTVVHLGEVEFVFFGYSLSSILGGFFNLAVFVQVVSISVFIASAPILVVADKFIELGFFERVFVFSAAVATYLVSQLFFGAEGASSMLYAVVVFLALLIFLRWQGLFINRKQASLRS